MATQPIGDRFISVEEYLSTGYEPDCEYDDGVIVERNLGEFEHSFLQIFLGTILTNNMDQWGVFVSWFRKFRQGFKWRLCSPAA